MVFTCTWRNSITGRMLIQNGKCWHLCINYNMYILIISILQGPYKLCVEGCNYAPVLCEMTSLVSEQLMMF